MIYFSFIVSVVSLIGSLYFSEIKGFIPCNLCWYQRILMYPLPFLILISLIKDDKDIKYYLGGLSLIGIIIAGYHNFIQFNQKQSAFCSITSNCSTVYEKYFDFITIPLMSLVAFLLIFLASCFIKINSNIENTQD